MTDELMEWGRVKARRYASELDRFNVTGLTVRGDDGLHDVTCTQGVWGCSCPFWAEHGHCPHVIAVRYVLRKTGLGD